MIVDELYKIAWEHCPHWENDQVHELVAGWLKTFYHFVNKNVEAKQYDKTNIDVSSDIQNL